MRRKQVIAAGLILSVGLLLGGCQKQSVEMTESPSVDTVESSVPESESKEETIKESSTEEESNTEQTAQNSTEASSVEESTETSQQQGEQEMVNGYEIKIKCPADYLTKQSGVKYGELKSITYYSTTCEKDRKANVLLPAGYTEEKQYPVIYLLHGIFGDENTMVGGTVNTIGNMMAEGITREAIVVYPYMYASKTKDACTAIDVENTLAYDNFINDLVTDLMPYMAANYSVLEGKENTAIMGFSMGARESLAIGLQRPDLFGYVGAVAPAPGLVPGKDWAMEHPGQFREEEVKYEDETPYMIFLCTGDSDKTVGRFPYTYHDLYEKNGIEHTFWEIPGSDHGDPAISSLVYNFLRYIFQ